VTFRMEVRNAEVVQMGSETCCGLSDGERDMLCWFRWGVRITVVGQMGSGTCSVGSDGERDLL
jgi:hypothetical protein